ncbi:MAG TPA: glycosyltransferase family 4 protein, partial [Thermodesulfovibrionales bacterium]|nr:glycosyltransferase family 4 protein [Thermodesulfovibrionales bacterium]
KHLDGTDYILFFGKLQILKGPQILSKTIPGLLKIFSNLKVVFVGGDFPFGSGTMKSYIESENRKYIENLVFLDNIPQNLLFPVIEQAKLIILPSLWENFPYACLEAMSLGKTVIGTRRTGFEELIEDGVSGILVDPGSPEALEKAVLNTLQSKNLEEMGQRAKKRAAEFSSDKVVPRILEYYNQIVRKVA